MFSQSLPTKGHLADKDVLKEIGNNELGRFKKALFGSSNKLFEEKSVGLSPKDSVKLKNRTDRVAQIISWFAEDLLDSSLLVLGDPNHERKPWEEHFTGVRSVARTSPQSYLFTAIARLLRLDDTARKTDVYRMLSEAKKFITNYEFAKKHLEKYENESENLMIKYAILKTWEKEQSFERVSTIADTAVSGAIEVIIEGPFKLALMITEDQILVFVQLLSFMSSFDIECAGSAGQNESVGNLLLSRELVKRSPMYEIARELLGKAFHEYHKLWKEECMEIRSEFMSDEQTKRFVTMFEDGTYFVRKE
jgi:hypothetical protein